MSSAPRAFHIAARNAVANIAPPTAPAWSWRSTADPGLFELWHGDQSVGTLSVLPGYIDRRAVVMDDLVETLNNKHT